MHMFLFKEEEHVDTYIWELQDTVWGQRISASGPRVLLPEIQKRRECTGKSSGAGSKQLYDKSAVKMRGCCI